jgi:hypothetical protein
MFLGETKLGPERRVLRRFELVGQVIVHPGGENMDQGLSDDQRTGRRTELHGDARRRKRRRTGLCLLGRRASQ